MLALLLCVAVHAIHTVRLHKRAESVPYVLTKKDEDAIGVYLAILDNAKDKAMALQIGEIFASKKSYKEAIPTTGVSDVIEKGYELNPSGGCPWAKDAGLAVAYFRGTAGLTGINFAEVVEAIEEVLGKELPKDPVGTMGVARAICTTIFDDMLVNGQWEVTDESVARHVTALGRTIPRNRWTPAIQTRFTDALKEISANTRTCPFAAPCMAFAKKPLIIRDVESFVAAGWKLDGDVIKATLVEVIKEVDENEKANRENANSGNANSENGNSENANRGNANGNSENANSENTNSENTNSPKNE